MSEKEKTFYWNSNIPEAYFGADGMSRTDWNPPRYPMSDKSHLAKEFVCFECGATFVFGEGCTQTHTHRGEVVYLCSDSCREDFRASNPTPKSSLSLLNDLLKEEQADDE